ncbi:L-threo-3-hydroxyaspartate ammonia-lyase [Hyphomicrobiales bacterium]|nr:L-threo-3-hydroxyaspartate ammonia-lyase [Hyphomicrobiales bacterium]CAH1697976.1 L-threo-3-hydroxyaspartate ammonia-lyase [Hyphomicrobiales bacterium]CAI0347623.1 L-threo-3-hydroxyaspartate ammonia-lyase [Hyphomicrobiales bacterium]
MNAATTLTLPTYADVERAAERLKGVAHHTPAMSSATANRRTGASLVFKPENLQRMGAFKFRGGYNAISALSAAQKKAGVLTFSSGNHAQAIAYAGKLLGVPTTIIMPEDAPQAKVEATQGYGGEVVRYDRYTQDRLEIGNRIAVERGLTLIPPYDHADVIAGQGTATKELIEDAGPFDILIVPLGGGGLLAGAALAAKALNPECRIFGVEPEAGNDGQQSLRSGKIVKIGVPKTIADGAQTAFLGDLTFPIIQRDVEDILTVSDAELVETMRFFAERMKLVVEPTGCLAAAAALTAKIPVEDKRVGVIISGGNVDLASFARFLAPSA